MVHAHLAPRSQMPALRRNDWEFDDAMVGVICMLAEQTGGLPDSHAEAEPRLIQESGVGANCAEHFANDTFVLRDFCWCDGDLHPWNEELDEPSCPPNFEHFASGIKGEWYKYLARDVRFNRVARHSEALAVLNDCLRSLTVHPTHEHFAQFPAVNPAFRAAMGWDTNALR